jgi:hypothetical protein
VFDDGRRNRGDQQNVGPSRRGPVSAAVIERAFSAWIRPPQALIAAHLFPETGGDPQFMTFDPQGFAPAIYVGNDEGTSVLLPLS